MVALCSMLDLSAAWLHACGALGGLVLSALLATVRDEKATAAAMGALLSTGRVNRTALQLTAALQVTAAL